MPNALALVTRRWKFLWRNIKSTMDTAMKTDVTNINSKCIYTPDCWEYFPTQLWNSFSDCYKLGLFRPMRKLRLLFRACALILNTISARWQCQTATLVSWGEFQFNMKLIHVISPEDLLCKWNTLTSHWAMNIWKFLCFSEIIQLSNSKLFMEYLQANLQFQVIPMSNLKAIVDFFRLLLVAWFQSYVVYKWNRFL